MLLLLQIAGGSFFNFFLNFLSNGPHKTMFGIFKILINEIVTKFSRFVNMGPNKSENFKMLLLLKSATRNLP